MTERDNMFNGSCAIACHASWRLLLGSVHPRSMKWRLFNIPTLQLCIVIALLFGTLDRQIAFAYMPENSADCREGTLTTHTFSSGASWSLCIQSSDSHALEVTSVQYRAPGDTLRSVIERLHAGQILIHYHDEPEERAQLGHSNVPGRLLPMNSGNCDGELLDELLDELMYASLNESLNESLSEREGNYRVCSRVEDNRILAKYGQRPALQSQRWELTSALQRENLVWATSLSFTEDGQIIPAVTLSGRARQSDSSGVFTSTLPGNKQHLARATVLTTWRMVFNLNDGAPDSVQQFDFPLMTSQENRRPMQVTLLDTESFVTVERDQFRGWRIMDATGAGYYLDPANSGFSYTGSRHRWASFDLALTRFKDCERHALANHEPDNSQGTTDGIAINGTDDAFTPASCGASLDDFVNGEPLQDSHPVLWYSQSRTFNPSDEHWPVISNFHQSFTLQPFDWTKASPFEVVQ